MSKSSRKGKAGENKVVQLLKEWWKDERFVRNWVGQSGAIGTMIGDNKAMPQHLIEAMSADIITPDGFPFSIESKNYSEVDLYEIIRNPQNATVVEFFRQAKRDAMRGSKKPLVMFKEDRKQYYVIFEINDLLPSNKGYIQFKVDGVDVKIMAWSDFTECYPKESFQ